MQSESEILGQEPLLLAGANAVLSVVLAARCAACESVLAAPLAGPVCSLCWNAVRFITPPICDACGDPLPSWQVFGSGVPRCVKCVRSNSAIDRGRAVGEYQGALRQIIHTFKYERRRSLARRLGEMMRARGSEMFEGADFVVPVPLHPRRERARGFNQAAELAWNLGPPVWPMLRRIRLTMPQVELPEPQRHGNVSGAFALERRHRWARIGRREPPTLMRACVLLVDDVTTTGATLEACAHVLKEAGAREVRALTVARVVRRQCAPRLP